MVDVNRLTTPQNTRWKLVDRATGAESAAIESGMMLTFRVE